ncbi:SWIB/MDM2 domain-containing protein [Mariannaea sp. PMI_226]|nr:SWIB/MDM2 domain-containing protein [Mariannaea sp. PMI_226]
MSTPLTSEELESYTALIDNILATADLETISRKKIRQGLEAALGGKDLSDQKAAIKKLIEDRFDAISGNDAAPVADPNPSSTKRAASHVTSDAGETEPSASPEPARKKAKRSSSVEDADARLAAQLQAQENSLARGRKTRGGDKPKAPKKKAAPRKKSSKKVKAEDDSDVDSADGVVKKRKAGGGFQKPFNLSPTLSELCGETQLSRPQVVKKLWEHIKANELQDPKDKRQIICDEKMHAVFKQSKVDMFRMNKEIGNHLYPVGEE